jgi:hypothetical protein
MRRIALVLGLCTLLLPMAAWADIVNLTNESGSVTITDAGIATNWSELTGFSHTWRHAPPGHDLGSLSFSTGTLVSGSLFGGGIFSGTGSSFDVIGSGKYGVPKGSIFSGSFDGPIYWTLISHTGGNFVFDLSGELSGTLYNGRSIYGATEQTIYVNRNQWNQTERGHLQSGHTNLGAQVIFWAEPGTLGLSATGLIMIVAITMRRKFIRA